MLGSCDDCIRLSESCRKCSNQLEKDAWKFAQTQHLQLQRAECISYQSQKIQSETNPLQCWSIILDYTEKFKLPQYVPFPKSWVRSFRPEVECAGLINHGLQKRELVFHWPSYPHNANLLLSILWHHMYRMLLLEQHAHPQELFLQADNCWRENKNRWVLAFCSWMVMIGLFRKVTLSFLLQGHTHADVDQLFVGIAKKYTCTILWTLRDMFDVIPAAYPTEATRPAGVELPYMFNWKEYFNPHLMPLEGHTGPHAFVFC